MKKGILIFLFAALLAPSGLYANFISSAINNCNLPAPENLHIVSYGTNSVQVAWNPVQDADSYQVTTRNATTNAILSDFFIDQPYATIIPLPDDVPLKIIVKAVDPNGCVGVETYIFGEPLGLVFDLVLAPNDGDVPEIDCLVECTVSAIEEGQPSVPQFACQIELVPEVYSYFPFWLEIQPPVIRGDVTPPLFKNLYLYIYPEITIQNEKTYRATHVEPHFYTPNAQWLLYEASNNPGLVRVFNNSESGAEVCNFEVNVGNGNITIFLANGYTATKKDDCPYVSWIPGSGGLVGQQTTPTIYETMAPSGNPAESDFNPANSKKTSSAFRIVNPVKSELVLFFEEPTGPADILELYSINGILAAQQQLPEGVSTYSLQADHLAPGTYLVKINQKWGIQTRLVVKQ